MGEKIQLSSFSRVRERWKTILVLAVVVAASFSIGVFANRVIVQNVQSLAGNHVLVPAPELQILQTTWAINGTASLVTGVKLNLTTVGLSGSPIITKIYQIFVQVSCLDAAGVEFTCSTGNGSVALPSNMSGAQFLLPITLSTPIDPEATEVHDLSYIVTGAPDPGGIVTPAGMLPSIVLGVSNSTLFQVPIPSASPTVAPGQSATTLILALASGNGGAGTVNLNAGQLPSGLTACFTLTKLGRCTTTATVDVMPGMATHLTVTLTAAAGLAPGNYTASFVGKTGLNSFNSHITFEACLSCRGDFSFRPVTYNGFLLCPFDIEYLIKFEGQPVPPPTPPGGPIFVVSCAIVPPPPFESLGQIGLLGFAGFTGLVDVTLSVPPVPGLNVSFAVQSGGGFTFTSTQTVMVSSQTSFLTIVFSESDNQANNTPPGIYTVTLTATSVTQVHTMPIYVVVEQPITSVVL